ncbi:MAG: hypothetical protein F4038_12965 [Chloroflexi bacterium]|nr:hypothetical protein [Chloroflexota bacterium]MYG90822.1 hypothetical protein [Chloroflexota bacterium]MYJ93943.1 hypothetical protein [Chloroflexota bacterium]
MTTTDTSTDDSDNTDHRLPQQQEALAADSVVIKFSNDGLVLELEGDDVDLGTDLKVRNEHRLIAEFRRDAVDGWWFKSSVISEPRSVHGEE